VARIQINPEFQSIDYDSDGTNGISVGEVKFNTDADGVPGTAAALLSVKRVLAASTVGPNILTTAGASSADITITGAKVGDLVLPFINGTTANPSVSVKGFVKSADTVTVTGTISVAGVVDLSAAGSLTVLVIGLT
jgi:hypothetical protein